MSFLSSTGEALQNSSNEAERDSVMPKLDQHETFEATTRSMPFTLRQLQLFVATAESGTITRAAERLFLSETAVSLAVGQLERALNVKLLERRRAHGVTLTSTGETFLHSARKILGDSAQILEELTGSGEVLGTVSSGCFLTLGPILMPELVKRYQALHPRAQLRMRENVAHDLHSDLNQGLIDLFFAFDLQVSPKLARLPLFEFRAGVLLPENHPLANVEGPIDVRELEHEPFILLDNPISESHSLTICREAGFEPHIAFRTQNFETMRSFTGRGLGWGMALTDPATPHSYEGHGVIRKEIANATAPIAVVAVWRNDRSLSRSASALLDIAVDIAKSESIRGAYMLSSK